MKKITLIAALTAASMAVAAQSANRQGGQPPLVYQVENTGVRFAPPAMPAASQLPVVRELPDPLRGVTAFSDWTRRRSDIGHLIQHYGIGTKPAIESGQVTARMEGDTLLVYVTAGGHTLRLKSTIHYPKTGQPPFALMIGTSMMSLPRPLFDNRPIAIMTFHEKQVNDYGQWGPHHERGQHPFDRLYPHLTANGAYSEWAWGLSRLLDGLQLLGSEVTKIDMRHIGVTGCSYAGKMALYCGAFDERVALTIAQEPGGGGAAAWRKSHESKENVESLDKTDYHWFLESQRDNFKGDNVYRLPYDQHELCAMVCPRALLLLGNPDYKWLADDAMLPSAQAARRVWERFGIADRMGWSIVDGHGHCQLPERQWPEVQAFIDKFLLGRTADTRNVTIVSVKPSATAKAEPAAVKPKYQWQDTQLPVNKRVESLIAMLKPDEKVGLMMNKSASIDRLGIPSYNWWSEACHGVRQDGYTVYPQPIGMAAAFNAQLVRRVFSQVSDEARANWNRSDHNVFNVPQGATYYPGNPELTFWCPNVNIFRDPRWGRGQETCGEDPYLNAVLGVETVLGMQEPAVIKSLTADGHAQTYYKTHACAKHYAVHSGPEPLRHSMNVEPTNRDLWETYLPAFKALVKKGNVREVMCAYQRFEGKPCCTSDRLLIDILRNKWGYDGLVVTDCDAINNFYNRGQHETHKDPLSASVDAVLNGTDLECGKVFMSLSEGLKKGLIQESDLDQHLRRTLTGRFELGMFDPADQTPWARLAASAISSDEHDQLATQAARESMVLLENHGVLPLSKSIRKLAVVGPNAADVEMLNGNYGGTPTKAHQHSLLSGIQAALPNTDIVYHKACELNDDYQTVHHLHDFNDGKGVKVEFYNNKELNGTPVKTAYYNELSFSTFGAWGFAEGVDNDNLSVRISGSYKATFTGDMKYTLMTDNGYRLSVNGQVVEEAKPAPRRGFGRRGATDYKSFPVEKGHTYDLVIEYRRGNGQFAMLRGDICERKLVDFSNLAREVSTADAIVIIGGISARMEGEGGDKQDIELPAVQQRLLRAMHDTGRPVIFVNCSGSAIAFGSVEGQYDALLQAWYPGQGGARALADVLLGDYNPGGKLPVTFYRSTQDLPDFMDYSMKNRTYRYFTGQPQYAFGYGLSYTTFTVGKAKTSAKAAKAGSKGAFCTLSVPVTNTGQRTGTETIQVYVKSLDDDGAPIKALKGFQKLTLQPGETRMATITLDGEAFEYYDEAIDELSVKPGRYQLLYGTSSLDSDLQVADFTVR